MHFFPVSFLKSGVHFTLGARSSVHLSHFRSQSVRVAGSYQAEQHRSPLTLLPFSRSVYPFLKLYLFSCLLSVCPNEDKLYATGTISPEPVAVLTYGRCLIRSCVLIEFTRILAKPSARERRMIASFGKDSVY